MKFPIVLYTVLVYIIREPFTNPCFLTKLGRDVYTMKGKSDKFKRNEGVE